MSDSVASVKTHSLTINNDLSWMAFAPSEQHHMCPLSDIPNWLNNELLKVQSLTAAEYALAIQTEISWYRKRGNSLPLRVNKLQVLLTQLHQCYLYTQTVRHKFVNFSPMIQSVHSVSNRDILRMSFHHWKKTNTSPRINTESTSLRYLNTPDRHQWYCNPNICSDTAGRKVKRMMDKLTEKEDMHHDLQSIMNEMTSKVRGQHSEDSFRRIFWEAQLEALQTRQGIRH